MQLQNTNQHINVTKATKIDYLYELT